jgi:hypothetical protein
MNSGRRSHLSPPPLVLGGVLAAIIVMIVAVGRTIMVRRQ